LDDTGHLWVADSVNNRVLRYDNAAAKADGADADGVLGQPNFTSTTAATTQSGMDNVAGVAGDASGRLYVSEADNNRILIFNDAVNKANGANADNVLGQTDFTTGTCNTGGRSASTLCLPTRTFYSSLAADVLLQADWSNHRVLMYGTADALSAVKSVAPNTGIEPDDVVTYTVYLRNIGSGNADSVVFTDTLPAEVDFAYWVENPAASVANDEITWNGTVTATSAITFTFAVTYTGAAADSVVNTAEFSSTTQTGSADATFTVEPPPIRITAVYTNFDSTNTQLFQLNGDAALSGDRLELAVAPFVEAYGSAWWQRRVTLQDDRSFSSYFSFQISNPGNGGADGLVFAIQTESSSAGGSGGGMGYGGITNSVGIEFDIFQNVEYGDPAGHHVGLDTNGSVTSLKTANPPASLLSGIWHVWVNYDGPSDALEVRMNQNNSARPASATLTDTIDLESVFGSDVYVGFTAAAGWAYADHEVLSFYFNNDYLPGGITPDTQTYEWTPFQVDLTASPSSIPADGAATSTITATVRDVDDSLMAGETVSFTTDLGTVSPESGVTDASGVATTTLTAGTTPTTTTVRGSVVGGAYGEDQVALTMGYVYYYPLIFKDCVVVAPEGSAQRLLKLDSLRSWFIGHFGHR